MSRQMRAMRDKGNSIHEATSLQNEGFVHIGDCLTSTDGANVGALDMRSFGDYWQELGEDRYMKREDTGSRRRAYGTAKVALRSKELNGKGDLFPQIIETANDGFHQPDNPYANGKRVFASAPASLYEHPIFRQLVDRVTSVLQIAEPSIDIWDLGFHMIRICAGAGMIGNPAPEGHHRDGHDFVAQVFIDRDLDIEGGISLIYDERGVLQFAHTMTRPFEAVIVDDRRVFHDVVPIFATDGKRVVHRDMLLLDFNIPQEAGSEEFSP